MENIISYDDNYFNEEYNIDVIVNCFRYECLKYDEYICFDRAGWYIKIFNCYHRYGDRNIDINKVKEGISNIPIEQQHKLYRDCLYICDYKKDIGAIVGKNMDEINKLKAEIEELKKQVAMIDDLRTLFANYTEI